MVAQTNVLIVTKETVARADRIARAMRVVSKQAGCPLGDALWMMADRATAGSGSVEEIATAVMDGDIQFGVRPDS